MATLIIATRHNNILTDFDCVNWLSNLQLDHYRNEIIFTEVPLVRSY